MISGSMAIPASNCCSSTSLLEFKNYFSYCNYSKRFNSIINCNAKNHEYKVPKLEPFSRSKFERAVKDPPLIQKSESQIADYCSVLEGEDSYSCWQAYFELKELEKESSKEEVERLIIEAGGVKSLIGCLHGVAAIHKAHKEASNAQASDEKKAKGERERKIHVHVPDGLPRSAEEIEEDEKSMMPDSSFTRMLRHRGKHPAWYSPVPDHETD
ncbi:CCG-binding protein 1-like [Chenopodium quinoa]|uniref:Maternal effect embryo arrest 14 n=1 Tax=Chenopodium quinoa TaxID=63459 RepID=A0A803LE04_CHEQI|nr:CCG-binding protein 1-like [Chenopodium quinoa]